MDSTEESFNPSMTAGTPQGLGLNKASKKKKPKRSPLLDKAAERGQLGYSSYPTSATTANAMSNIEEE